MVAWMAENLATLLICLGLLLVVTAIVVHLIRNKRKGKSSCGCNCTCCGMAGSCHKK